MNNDGKSNPEEADKYFRLIAENLTDMVAVLDTSGRRLYCTPNYKLLGSTEKLAGSDSFEDIHPEDRERIKNMFFETVRSGRGQSTQYRLLLKDGRVRQIQSQGVAIKSAGDKVEKVIIVSRDITESLDAAEKHKALELQLLQADKLNSLGKTVSGVAHELNNPLTGIMGFCQLLLRDEVIQANSRHREDITTIFQEAERCQKIVRNLTTFARKHKPEKTYLGLNGLLEDSLRLQAHQLKLRGVEVSKELAPELPMTMADFHQLQQVFMNLLGNAQDAMEGQAGRKLLHIKTRQVGQNILVEISDSGPGIPAGFIENIFEPFFTTKDPGKGTGLGLSISFGIISEHGGRIWAETTTAGGAKFCIEIPVVTAPAAENVAGASENCQAFRGKRVLIVDDEQCVVDVTVRILRLLDISPDTARDPETGRKKLEAGMYDAVLCDYRLPGQTGLELYKLAIKLKPELEKRWIFLTGSSGAGELSQTGRPVLTKPYTVEALQELLGKVLA